MATHFRSVVNYTRSRTGIPLESHNWEVIKTRWRLPPIYVVILHMLAFYGAYTIAVANYPVYNDILSRWYAMILKG